ncbi:MAG: adenylyl-sulfate kinase [Lentisphaerae bacterium GWF2_44_16]|nr:MAG: adenylyl-sulfate kinase [Lentisphaerae bacterium GWF2_44_16]
MDQQKDNLKVVIAGHVDHGKSTIIGRLLAESGSLPQGKLEQIQESCRKNSKPFEYAFLLDALKNEQSQGITIDMARCFFKTPKRNYIIIDAPGHIEFLKNMVTGAAKADAALLVIDAHEGIQENSKRHGYMLSMLGVQQVVVLINKFDLVNYDRNVYEKIVADFSTFLGEIDVAAISYIPVSGRHGDNIVTASENVAWYKGPTLLEQLDSFAIPQQPVSKVFRMPVQDVYKFTADGDERRIIAGTIETGRIKVGDEVIFLPSGKESSIKSIEIFNHPEENETGAGHAIGFTLISQIYIKAGEVMCRKGEKLPEPGNRLRVNIFWLSKSPMIKGKRYKFKLGSTRESAELAEIINVFDASDLSTVKGKQQLDRHDIGECIIETARPVAFDNIKEIESMGRFVIVDNYEISGGGVILEKDTAGKSVLNQHVTEREFLWDHGLVTPQLRAARFHHRGKFVLLTGTKESGKHELAKELEHSLFNMNLNAYYLGLNTFMKGLDVDLEKVIWNRDEHIRRLGELARIMTGAGLIFISAIDDLDRYDIEYLKQLNSPNELLVINIGITDYEAELNLPENYDMKTAVNEIKKTLNRENIIPEYCI